MPEAGKWSGRLNLLATEMLMEAFACNLQQLPAHLMPKCAPIDCRGSYKTRQLRKTRAAAQAKSQYRWRLEQKSPEGFADLFRQKEAQLGKTRMLSRLIARDNQPLSTSLERVSPTFSDKKRKAQKLA